MGNLVCVCDYSGQSNFQARFKTKQKRYTFTYQFTEKKNTSHLFFVKEKREREKKIISARISPTFFSPFFLYKITCIYILEKIHTT